MQPTDLIERHFRLTPAQTAGLRRLKLETLQDLLCYFPSRYEPAAPTKTIAELVVGEHATLHGQIIKAKTGKAFYKKTPMAELWLEDQTGKIKLLWFHQAYMAKRAPEGSLVRVTGKVAERSARHSGAKGEKYIANPAITGVSDLGIMREPEAGTLVPIYAETKSLSSLWFEHHIKRLLEEGLAKRVTETLPAEIIARYHLPNLESALVFIHQPQKAADAVAARKRFSFEEVFLIQLERGRARQKYQAAGGFAIKSDQKELENFLARFPFAPTGAQKRAITQILTDFNPLDTARGKPMTRLLEGDVGSGKTLVAAATAYTAVRARPEAGQAGYQVAYMAPTEILARQHYESFIDYFAHLPINIGLITGAEARKFPSKISVGNERSDTHISRAQMLKWVASGEIAILLGTQALIQKGVRFRNLAYVIIDEQHRFGINQRSGLVKKGGGPNPHLLSMTATPIPRTLALTIYGDLDLTLLDELPPGRRPVITKVVNEHEREQAYQKISSELEAGRQAYIICPRIDEPDPTKELALETKSAKQEAKIIAEKFPQHAVGLLHSKLKPADKERVINDFRENRIQILVSTSVVEVGVNVPNATVIVIEGAERFGLAQLHQLRGRVLRSSAQAYCYLFTTEKGRSLKTQTQGPSLLPRLKALQEAKNGFELAERDLALRGAGTLAGSGKQWGVSDLAMEALQNLKMVEAARAEAGRLLATDPELKQHPELLARLHKPNEMHFE